jgi:hypothetical protein
MHLPATNRIIRSASLLSLTDEVTFPSENNAGKLTDNELSAVTGPYIPLL